MNRLELEIDLSNLQITDNELAASYDLPLVHLQKLCRLAQIHIQFSPMYMQMLKSMSNPLESSNNPCPWKCVKEGSYLMGNAYDLVKFYKQCISGPVDNRDIAIIDAFLTNVGFDRSHITRGYTAEAYGGKTECFVSKGQGKKYYELLHSKFNIHLRYFIEMVEKYVNVPVINFLETKREELESKLFEAVKDNNCSEIEDWIESGKSLSLRDKQGRTLLHSAVNSGNIGLVKILLSNGADISLVTNVGNYTVLHMATSKGNTKMVQLLLECASQDVLFYLINARMTLRQYTSLHIAAMNGNFDIVKLLLKHGAMYNIKNNAHEVPLSLSKNQLVTNLLNTVDLLFEGVKTGKNGIIEQLKALKPEEATYIMNARNNQGNTLLQFCVINNFADLVMTLLNLNKKKS